MFLAPGEGWKRYSGRLLHEAPIQGDNVEFLFLSEGWILDAASNIPDGSSFLSLPTQKGRDPLSIT
jgi:hypothetical protein